MKKLVIFFVSFFILGIFSYSCEEDPFCKHCTVLVKDNQGNIIEEEDLGEVCGEDLDELGENGSTTTVGETTGELYCY